MFRQFFVPMMLKYLANFHSYPITIREMALGVFAAWVSKAEEDSRPWICWSVDCCWSLSRAAKEHDIEIMSSPDYSSIGALRINNSDDINSISDYVRRVLEQGTSMWHTVGEAIDLSSFADANPVLLIRRIVSDADSNTPLAYEVATGLYVAVPASKGRDRAPWFFWDPKTVKFKKEELGVVKDLTEYIRDEKELIGAIRIDCLPEAAWDRIPSRIFERLDGQPLEFFPETTRIPLH